MKPFLVFLLFCSCAALGQQYIPRSVGVVNGQILRDDDGNVFLDAGGHSITSDSWSIRGDSSVSFGSDNFRVDVSGNTVVDAGTFTVNNGISMGGGILNLNGNIVLSADDGSASFAGGAFTIDQSGETTVNGELFANGGIAGNGASLTGLTFSQIGSTPTTLAGYGISDAQAKATTAQLLAQTAAVASVATVTAPDDAANHLYTCGGTITVTAISANTITLQVTYTDETNASRTQSFFGEGLTVAAVSTTGGFTFPPLTIWAKPNTAVTIKTTVTGVGSETYDVAGWIQKLD